MAEGGGRRIEAGGRKGGGGEVSGWRAGEGGEVSGWRAGGTDGCLSHFSCKPCHLLPCY